MEINKLELTVIVVWSIVIGILLLSITTLNDLSMLNILLESTYN